MKHLPFIWVNYGHWQIFSAFSRPIRRRWRQRTVSALRKHATLLRESVNLKQQARSSSHSSAGSCRHGAGKAPALTRRRKKNAAQWTWVREWLCVCVVIWLACWADAWPNSPLNCKCRHKQGTSTCEPGYVQKRTDTWRSVREYFRYGLGYVQIRTGIRAETDWDTCRYELEYVQIRTGYVQIRKNIRIGVRTIIRTNKYAKIRT